MKALLAFVLLVTIGAIWETKRDRPQRPWPLLALCTSVALGVFSLSRLL